MTGRRLSLAEKGLVRPAPVEAPGRPKWNKCTCPSGTRLGSGRFYGGYQACLTCGHLIGGMGYR